MAAQDRLYFTALLVVQQGPMGSAGSVPLDLELAMSIHVGVMGRPGGCGFISQPRAEEPYRTFMVQSSHAELADALLHSLQFPERAPDLSWKDNLTGDAWTAITIHVESCDATGQTSGRSVHHTLVEPARYQGADAANFQTLLACLLEMADARDTAFWQVVSGKRSTPPPPRVVRR